MNYHALDDKIRAVSRLPQFTESGVNDDTLLAFSHALEGRRGWDLIRINPLAFAEQHGLGPDETIILFLFGTKTGLFTFEWSLLCPLCGGREHSYGSLNMLDKEVYHCSLCDVDATVEADNHLEVSFSMPPTVSGEWPDPHVSLSEYRSYFFSSSIVRTPELDETLAVSTSGPPPSLRFAAVPAGKRARINLEASGSHRIVSLDTHSIFTVHMKDDPDRTPEPIDLVHTDTGFDRREAFATPAPTQVRLVNRSSRIIGCLIGSPDPASLRDIMYRHPPLFKPFLTGKMIFNNQRFRDLFLADGLPDNLSLKINDLTLLVADHKDATARSGRTDDVFARRREQRHGRIIRDIVQAHRGGIVKTLKGAIMASFNVPADGIKAAVRMSAETEAGETTPAQGDEETGLKIGLHRGTVMAIKANQTLDFFGRAVNIVSRVQGLAGAGEILVTDDVMRDDAAAALLRAAGYSAVPQEVALKGVENPVQIHSCKK